MGVAGLRNRDRQALKIRFWPKVLLPDANGCMIWTGAVQRTGYGSFRFRSHQMGAHRASLILAEGDPVQSGMDAAHSCRNRLCVAPLHLRWATRAENEADKAAHGVSNRGTRNGNAKLTENWVREIRLKFAEGGISKTHLAAEYGVNRMVIHRVITKKAWAWVGED